jgi:sugar phosphate isomerase/epimerase
LKNGRLEGGVAPGEVARMPFAICNEIFEGWEFARACAFARETGYEGIEIAPFTFAPLVTRIGGDARAGIRSAASDAGLTITGIHWVLAKTEGFHVNSPDAAVRARTADYLKALVEFCAEIGGHTMVFGSPGSRRRLDGVSEADAAAWTLETFRPAISAAEGAGVVICLEALSPAETNFLNMARDAAALAAQAGSPSFRIMLDVKAMCSEPDPPADIIRGMAGKFAYFHANDKNLKGPGFGDVDFRPIAAALRDVGYQGWVSVEVFNFDEGAEVIARKSLEHLKSVF